MSTLSNSNARTIVIMHGDQTGEELLQEALPGDRIAILGARDDTLSEFAAGLVERLGTGARVGH